MAGSGEAPGVAPLKVPSVVMAVGLENGEFGLRHPSRPSLRSRSEKLGALGAPGAVHVVPVEEGSLSGAAP